METWDDYTPEYIQLVRKYWKQYIFENNPLPEHLPGIRPVILESWRRSQGFFVDQHSNQFAMLPDWELKAVLEENRTLIEVAHPYIENLKSYIQGTNFVIVLTDRSGCVIDTVVEDSGIKNLMQESELRVGVVRNERLTGTSGIAVCLATKAPLQILGEEHYIQRHHTYYCSAAPIHDAVGAVIGCLAMVGPREMTHTHTFGMVCIAADGIQKEFQIRTAYSSLAFANTQLKNMIQSLSSGVMLLDRDRRIIYHNHLVQSILNLPEGFHLDGKCVDEVISPASLPERVWDEPHSNVELTLATCRREKVDVLLTSVITSTGGTEKNITLILDEQRRVHQLVRKISGFTAKYTFESIIGISPGIQAMKEIGQKAAESTSNVLILGESGTGKELLAQSIHNAGSRASGPFIAVNCGSIPKNLIESELFGYESGAFTGARREGYPGKFELADGGTLFLDEIGDMPLELQTSLLRVLQNHEVTRIGGNRAKYVDVKVIAATNVDLMESARNGRFRQDLYYRLNVLSIHVPPLRERPEDIKLLSDYFISRYNRALHRQIAFVDDGVYEAFRRYQWPGNIRELENVIERAANLIQGDTLTLADLPPELVQAARPPAGTAALRTGGVVAEQAVRSPQVREREIILDALAREKGHVQSVAAALDMPVRTLYRKIKKYNLHPEQYRVWED